MAKKKKFKNSRNYYYFYLGRGMENVTLLKRAAVSFSKTVVKV